MRNDIDKADVLGVGVDFDVGVGVPRGNSGIDRPRFSTSLKTDRTINRVSRNRRGGEEGKKQSFNPPERGGGFLIIGWPISLRDSSFE